MLARACRHDVRTSTLVHASVLEMRLAAKVFTDSLGVWSSASTDSDPDDRTENAHTHEYVNLHGIDILQNVAHDLPFSFEDVHARAHAQVFARAHARTVARTCARAPTRDSTRESSARANQLLQPDRPGTSGPVVFHSHLRMYPRSCARSKRSGR
eukprot:4122244-Pleurochrysis_carterae.AAC.1